MNEMLVRILMGDLTKKLNNLTMLSLGTLIMKAGLELVRVQCLVPVAGAGLSRLPELESGALGLAGASSGSSKPAEDLDEGEKPSATSTKQ